LLLLNLLVQRGWFDVRSAAPVLQKSELETKAAIHRLELARIAEQPVVTLVDRVPDSEPPAWRFANVARRQLGSKLEHLLNSQNRQPFITGWAAHRQRVSSTEVSNLLGLSASHANTILTNLADESYLVPIRKSRRARGGVYYLPAEYIWGGLTDEPCQPTCLSWDNQVVHPMPDDKQTPGPKNSWAHSRSARRSRSWFPF